MLNNATDFIKNMPKIDLHCHLDGSFSTDFVRTALGITEDNLSLKDKLTAPAKCKNLAEYLTRFDLPISCIMTANNIKNGVIDVIRQASEENTKYIELRFAPTASLNDKLSYRNIYEAAIEGAREGEALYNCSCNILVCAMRHHDEESNLNMLHNALDYIGNGIAALDLAGDEASFPNQKFNYLFEYARKYNVPFTIHSGECGSAENVRYALLAGASRVGHGIALMKDISLMEECRKNRLGFELCPTSNYQTNALSEDEPYPLKAFLDKGLLATVNTDNRTVSNTNLTNELKYVHKKCGITENDIIRIYKNSVEIAFADDNTKHKLLNMLQ